MYMTVYYMYMTVMRITRSPLPKHSLCYILAIENKLKKSFFFHKQL